MVVTSYNKLTHIHFDGSVSDEGCGSMSNPQRTTSMSRIGAGHTERSVSCDIQGELGSLMTSTEDNWHARQRK